MSFFSPGYIAPGNRAQQSSTIIHEDPTQNIQGGIAGQHYHMSLLAYQKAIAFFKAGYVNFEPCMSQIGDSMIARSGDMMSFYKLVPGTNTPAILDVPA
jgi:hypothetical protein